MKHDLAGFSLGAAAILLGGCQTPDRDAMTVQMALNAETPSVSKGTIVVDYSRAGAKILTEEGGPACAFILPGVGGTFSDDGRGTLTARAQSKRGLRGPADVMACRMVANKQGTTATDIRQHLDVKLTEGEDGSGKVLDLSIPVSRARRNAAPAAGEAAATGPDAAAAEATAAGKMLADAEGKKRIKAVEEKPAAVVAKPAPKPVAPVPAAPAVAAPAVRPPAPPPSQPAGGPASANLGRSIINNPALSPAQQERAFPDYNNASNDRDPTVGTPGRDNDDDFDDSASDDDAAPAFEVTARVVRSVGKLGALQFEIAFQGDSGGWAGRGANVICDALTDGLAATNFPGGRQVKVGLVSLQGIDTPADVVKCIFRTHDRVSTGSFTINVTDASNTNTDSLPSLPEMQVTRVTPI